MFELIMAETVSTSWKQRNRPRVNERERELRRLNPGKKAAYLRAWRKKNAARVKETTAAWRMKNRTSILARIRAWKASRPEKMRSDMKRWHSELQERHPELVRSAAKRSYIRNKATYRKLAKKAKKKAIETASDSYLREWNPELKGAPPEMYAALRSVLMVKREIRRCKQRT